MNNENLSIGFIGAGRVGCTLGRYFYEKNLELSGYCSNTYDHACDAAAFTHSKAYKTVSELVRESRIIFITVPDLKIYEVYLKLKSCELKDKILCHCSGAMSAEVFEGVEALGAYGYSIHPAFAISDKKCSYKKINKAFITVEGSYEKMYVIEDIMKKLGNPFQIISSESKYKYHASLVTASNLVIGLYNIALEMLKECGFSDLTAAEVLNPLFINNAENVCNSGIYSALTGPVDRNDISTVEKHISVLGDGVQSKLYKILTGELIKLAKEKYPERDYTKLENLISR